MTDLDARWHANHPTASAGIVLRFDNDHTLLSIDEARWLRDQLTAILLDIGRFEARYLLIHGPGKDVKDHLADREQFAIEATALCTRSRPLPWTSRPLSEGWQRNLCWDCLMRYRFHSFELPRLAAGTP